MDHKRQWNRGNFGFNQSRSRMTFHNFRKPRYQSFSGSSYNKGFPAVNYEPQPCQNVRLFGSNRNSNRRKLKGLFNRAGSRRFNDMAADGWNTDDEGMYENTSSEDFRCNKTQKKSTLLGEETGWPDSDSRGYSWQEDKSSKIQENSALMTFIWEQDNDDNGVENSNSARNRPDKLMYSVKSIPDFDESSIIGEEGVFQITVYRCTFCNFICMDDDKCQAHMRSKYHYNHYKNYIAENQSVEDKGASILSKLE